MKIIRIFTLLSLCFIGLISCIFDNTSTREQYQNIQKIEIPECSIIINNPQKIKKIIDEVNSLNTGKWLQLYGKEVPDTDINLYDKNNNYFGLGLDDESIVQKGEGYRSLRVVGVVRHFDINTTPELKRIRNKCH